MHANKLHAPGSFGVVKSTTHNIEKSSKLSAEAKSQVSINLMNYRLPNQDYKRQLRSLDTIKSWKASELKLILLYGFISFIDTLSVNLFAHFFFLSSAMRILIQPNSDEEIDLAKELIAVFRELAPFFNGESAQTFNMHILMHHPDQVKLTGPLYMVFESAHFHLKRAVGPNTSAKLTTSLAVKRRQRRFFRSHESKKAFSVIIGSLKLRNPAEILVEINGKRDIFQTCHSCQYKSQNFFCHDTKCQWLSTGSCTHIIHFADHGVQNLGQLCSIFVDMPSRSASLQIKSFKGITSLSVKVLDMLRADQAVDSEIAVIKSRIEEILEIIDNFSDHFLLEELNDECTVIDIKNLISPCIFRGVGSSFLISVICTTFERD